MLLGPAFVVFYKFKIHGTGTAALNKVYYLGYDGARNMSGQYNGCAAKVRESCPEAVYVHCASHSLNLAITHACDVAPIRNCIATIKETVNYFRLSNKAGLTLKEQIQSSCPSARQTRLLKFCETRWVEHLDSLSLFHDVYEHICAALEELDERNIKSNGLQPHALLTSIRTSQFIIALTVMKPIFNLSKNLSVILQKEDGDLSRCVEYTDNLHDEIEDMRRNAKREFKRIFAEAKETAEKVGIELLTPRRAGRQLNRDNYVGDPETYFRLSIFIPFLDHFSNQLNSRFLQHRNLLSRIQKILPTRCTDMNTEEIRATVQTFEAEWPNDLAGSTAEFVAEITIWRR